MQLALDLHQGQQRSFRRVSPWLQLNHPEEPVGLPKVLVQATSKARVTEAAKVTTGEVLPADGSVNQWVGKLPTQPRKERASQAGVSEAQQKKLDSLARKAPSLFAQVQAGEMSTHRACIEAGIVKTPSPFAQVQRLWPMAGSYPRYP